MKGKVYSMVVRPSMICGLEMVGLRKRQVTNVQVGELKMLRFS